MLIIYMDGIQVIPTFCQSTFKYERDKVRQFC